MQTNLTELLRVSARQHSHLCPRQVLGVRIGLAGVAATMPGKTVRPHRLLVILETDGCFADGISAATGCTVGKRTLRIEDYGKVAATFVDVHSGRALRIAPRADVRQRAGLYAPGEARHYLAQLAGYQVMPDAELLTAQPVRLVRSVAEIMSRAGVRVACAVCAEEIINEREVIWDGQVLCRSCAGAGYYATCREPPPAPHRPGQGASCAQTGPGKPRPGHQISAGKVNSDAAIGFCRP